MRIIRFCCAALLCIFAAGAVGAAPRAVGTAETTCPPEGCQAFVPIVQFNVLPYLNAPSGTANSLAPVLFWTPITLGNHHVQVSSDETFGPSAVLIIDSSRNVTHIPTTPNSTLVSTNLKPSSLYFWRIGVDTPTGTFYTAPQSFSTPSADAGALPSQVNPLDPKPNAELRRDSVLLKWGAVPGALLYRIRMTDNSGKSFSAGTAYVDGAETTFWVRGLQGGQTYTWKIRAYNGFGWGSYSAERSFTIK